MFPIIEGQDSRPISEEAKKFNLSVKDKSPDGENFNFVGFVIENEKMLTVFPKHFYDNVNTNEKDLVNDAVLLFKTIYKYVLERKYYRENVFIGQNADFESNYPFHAFFEIYNYYQKYGIYKEEKKIVTENGSGKISWKKTIQKSNVIVSNKNFVFLPLYYERKNYNETFISECMVYVINHTIKSFPFFMDIKPILIKNSKMDFLSNREYTLRKLYQMKNNIFKDSEKVLVQSLIEFFETYNKKSYGGRIVIKIRDFSVIWELMVNKYLNNYFVGVDNDYKLMFSDIKNSKKKRFKKKKFDIDDSENKRFIQPDHYYEHENNVYVFDSKYYEEINDLEYKQLAYTLLLGNRKEMENKNVYSILILPKGNNDIDTKYHLKLNQSFKQLKEGSNIIGEHYLNIKKIMEIYIK